MWSKVKKASLDHVRTEPTTGAETMGDEKESGWAAANEKISATAKFAGSISQEEDNKLWEKRLNTSFYLDDGVSKWHLIHPIASQGKRQSPIDIETGKAKLDQSLQPIKVQYGAGCCTSMVNTGNSFKVDVNDKLTSLHGGGLTDEYKLVQFHAHWGTTAGAKGSEHTVNGKLYPAELHLVHWNTKYGLLTKAVTEPDGLAVIGIFLEVGPDDHPEFEKVVQAFPKIHYKNMTHTFQEVSIDPTKFLPEDMSYWHYKGSLTTPPLDESVMWHVVRTPIHISKRQLDAMASLRTGTNKECDPSCIINNFRPPLPVGERRVSLFTGEAAGAAAAPSEAFELESLKNEVLEMKKVMGELKGEIRELRQIKK